MLASNPANVRKTALACLCLLVGTAQAAPPTLAALTQKFANHHKVPVRVVKSDLGTREVERHFVPVLPGMEASFAEHFQSANGAVVWRESHSNDAHIAIGIKPGDAIAYESRHGATPQLLGPGQRFIALAMAPKHIAAWEGFIDTYTPENGAPYNWGRNDGFIHFDAAMKKLGQPVHGNCMWWITHATLDQGVALAHHFGVRRGKGPEVMASRLVHAGNEHVGPIGIPVASIELFNAMSDQQLLGPEPAGGAAEQVKE